MGLMRMIILSLILCLMFVGLVFAQENESNSYSIALHHIHEAQYNGSAFLNIVNLDLIELPPEIGNLHSLQILHIANTRISSLPPEIGNLSSLRELTIINSELTNLPPEIGNLTNLRSLQLNGNQLSQLPPEIGNLHKLCNLSLENNQFTHLPSELSQFDFLPNSCGEYYQGLVVDGNPLISPPPVVVAQGTVAILDYLRNEAWWHLQRLIVGGASSIGIVAAMVLGLRWRNRRRKGKKREKQFS